MRVYSDIGLWYFPSLDLIVPIVFGVVARDVRGAVIIFMGIRACALALGYLDVHWLQRQQYQNAVTTQLNPYLLNEIRRRKK